MDERKLVELVKRLQGDAKLKAEFDANPEAVVQRETGLALDAAGDILQGQLARTELSDDQLAAVAGGFGKSAVPSTLPPFSGIDENPDGSANDIVFIRHPQFPD